MHTPKLYQLQAVDVLTEFLRRSRALGGPAAAFNQLTSERCGGCGDFAGSPYLWNLGSAGPGEPTLSGRGY